MNNRKHQTANTESNMDLKRGCERNVFKEKKQTLRKENGNKKGVEQNKQNKNVVSKRDDEEKGKKHKHGFSE